MSATHSAVQLTSKRKAVPGRRFPPPWTVHESGKSFCLKTPKVRSSATSTTRTSQAGGSNMKRLTRDQARRIAVNIVKLPDYCSTRRRRPRNLTASCAFPSAIPLTLAAKMHRRPLQHSRNSELFRGSSFAGLQIAEGAKSLHGDGANRRCGD